MQSISDGVSVHLKQLKFLADVGTFRRNFVVTLIVCNLVFLSMIGKRFDQHITGFRGENSNPGFMECALYVVVGMTVLVIIVTRTYAIVGLTSLKNFLELMSLSDP